jgi:hypothetical protein
MKFQHFVLAGLAGALVVYGLGFLVSRGRAARLTGEITKVRTLGADERSSVAIVDFEAHNPSDVLMIVQGRELFMIDQRGIERSSSTISAADLKSLFQYFPALGEIENDPLIDRLRVPAGESVGGMVAARFEIPKHELDQRQRIILRIRDADGGISEISRESE